MEIQKKLEILQKRAVGLRIINNSGYKSRTDPILKSENILNIADIQTLQVSLFMYDYHSRTLPSSFDGFIPKKNSLIKCLLLLHGGVHNANSSSFPGLSRHLGSPV